MTHFWKGSRVRLRGVEPEDWTAFMRFDEHSGHQRSSDFLRPPRSAEGYRTWAARMATEAPEGDSFRLAIEALDTGAVVGVVNTFNAEPQEGSFSYGIGVGGDHQRKGYAAEAAVLLMRYMFAERRYHKCEVSVYAYNEASLALHRRLGFTEEGRLRDHAFLAGQYRDLVMMGMLAEEFAEAHSLGGL
ncbi:GNAT family protein [Streptomyces sp. NPDC000594]|uniref:GNAT family N-acetyltransferase n=1 Tax=Streptomyces sp. NPDC000594 TaxID=3154261 RepID=UPI003323E71C